MYYTYILYSNSKAKFYIGQTNNLQDRLHRHNAAQELATKYGIPWKLVIYFEFKTRSEAVKYETKIKKRGAKRFLQDINFDFNFFL